MKIQDKIELNKEQLQATLEIEGPTMVVAGPGTGKTQMLTARIANILLETDTPPELVTVIVFNAVAWPTLVKKIPPVDSRVRF